MNETEIPKHHIKQELCTTRPSYRDGRKLTTVKVYCVHQESQYLLVQNVPAVGAKDQLAQLFSTYGTIAELHALDDFPAEPFTEVYRVKFNRIQSARFAKKKLDDYSFFGGSLHITYAPEYETVKETRDKLQDRRKVIAAKIRQLEKEAEEEKGSQIIKQPAMAQNGDQQSLLPGQTLSLPPPPPPSELHPGPPSSFIHSEPTPAYHHENSRHFLEISADSPAGDTGGHHPVYNYQPDNRAACVHFSGSAGFNENEAESNYHMFTLPPPPRVNSSHHRMPHDHCREYGFAWVPSANATFPPGYDPRLPPEGKVGGKHQVTLSIPEVGVAEKSVQDERQPGSVSSTLVLHGQVPNKPVESSSNTHVTVHSKQGEKIVIKQYKPKGPTPRFLPRQVNKEKGVSETAGTSGPEKLSASKAKETEVNREIRKEAFRLGEEQGPVLPPDPKARELLLGQSLHVDRQVEASVLTSVKAIRKRLSKFISETVPKKQKMNITSSSTEDKATTD